MKCIKCGAELTEDTKFCSYCGSKIEDESQTSFISEETVEENIVEEVEILESEPTYTQSPKDKSIVDKAKEMFMSYWNKIDLFCKIETIVGAVAVLLLIISLLNAKILPILFSLLQVGGLVVAFLLYKGKIKTNKNWMKYLALVLSAFLTFVNISSYSWFNDFDAQEKIFNNFTKVNAPYSSQDCVNKNKDTVISDFRLAGFSNISEEEIEDLEITETDKYENVDSVIINGTTNFEANGEFKASSKVVIKYHSYKRESVPFSYDEAKNMETELILKAFEEARFVDIKTDEVYDLNPDNTDVAFENRISIDGTTSFGKDAKFPLNAKVKITTHRPYEMYNLKVVVDFVPNLIFSKYDVELEIGSNYETLTHGNDETFEYRLKQGKYTVEFTSEESSSVNGTAEIDLTGDTEVSYKIYCYSDRISVDTIYLENKGAVGENDAMVPSSASNCKFKNYKDIEKIFKNAGFTNITTEILYDIVLGWTDEGEVDKVSINGKTDFKRGDVFAKDAAIVITYHMKEEDDPNRKAETTTTNSNDKTSQPKDVVETKANITIENNTEFASLMKITDQTDTARIKAYANSHKGDIIEFDGCIALMMQHKKYKTRFDVCIAGGDYKGRVYGPLFAFEDVSYYEMKVTGSDTVSQGMLFRITAEIEGFSDEGNYIILEPKALVAR